jgi:starch synthase
LGITGLPESVFTSEGLEFYGNVCFLKSGIVYADILSTESKRYSLEIQEEEYGRGLEGVFQLRSKDLYGVVNGVNYKQYDPKIDPYIRVNYTKEDIEKKQQCKFDLLETCGLKHQPDRPLIGMIAPLYEEKGIDLLIDAFDQMMKLPIRFVFLNDIKYRNKSYAARLGELMAKHRKYVRCYTEYDEQLKHKILAGADMLLMPFHSEPCGVTQMYALKYGTIPIVRATGGLDDTVVEFHPDTGKGTGFKFIDYTPEALSSILQEALILYHNESLWDLLQVNAMRVDYSWVYSAKKYLDLYKLAMGRGKSNS